MTYPRLIKIALVANAALWIVFICTAITTCSFMAGSRAAMAKQSKVISAHTSELVRLGNEQNYYEPRAL